MRPPQGGLHVGRVHRVLRRDAPLPAEAVGGEVAGNAHDPCQECLGLLELVEALVGAQEAVLGDVGRGVGVAQCSDGAVDTREGPLIELGEGVVVPGLGPAHQVAEAVGSPDGAVDGGSPR